MEEEKEEGQGLQTAPAGSEERRAGGKLRRPSSRKPPATPYARPQQRGRWLSKLVDPARHLITGLPSFFSPSPVRRRQPQVESEAEEEEEVEEERDVGGSDEDGGSPTEESVPVAEGNAGTSAVGDVDRSGLELDRDEQVREVGPPQPPKLSEIEQLLAGRSFSRDEIQKLIGVLHSKSIDKADSSQERVEVLDTAIGGTLSSRRQSICDVGNSPVDIARVYMRSRTSEAPIGSPSITKDDRALVSSGDLILSPSPLPATRWPGALIQDQHQEMTPQSERQGFGLPSFQRTPYSRSIYSKTKSKLQGEGGRRLNSTSTSSEQSKLPAFGQVNWSPGAFNGGSGSVGPIRRTRNKLGGDTQRGSPGFSSCIFTPAQLESPAGSQVLFSGANKSLEAVTKKKKNKSLEAGSSSSLNLPFVESRPRSSDVGVPSHSSQIARKILEHLERNPATPKEKSAELKLATSWKKPETSNVAINMPNKHGNLHFGNLGSSHKADHTPDKSSLHLVGSKDPSCYNLLEKGATFDAHNGSLANNMNVFGSKQNPEKSINSPIVENHALSHHTTLAGAKPGTFKFEDHTAKSDVSITVSTSEPSPGLRQNGDSQIMSKHEVVHKAASIASSSELNCLPKKPPLAGTRPALPAISIGKPDHRWALPSDNNPGFTFPVSASSGGLFDPPTPSIVPSFSTSGSSTQKQVSSIPTFSFGLSRSTPPLVFSFPSTRNSPPQNDATDPKFTFGSDKEARLSFSFIKDSVRC